MKYWISSSQPLPGIDPAAVEDHRAVEAMAAAEDGAARPQMLREVERRRAVLEVGLGLGRVAAGGRRHLLVVGGGAGMRG